MRHYKEALGTLQRAYQAPPTRVSDYLDLAMAYAELDCWPSAIDAFQQAIRLRPDSTIAHFGLAVSYLTCNLRDAAWYEYHTLQSLDEASAHQLLQFICRQGSHGPRPASSEVSEFR